jgi:hypothetical protein
MTLDPKAYQEGFAAGEAGIKRCPYPAGTREAWSWHSGQLEGAAERGGFSYSTVTTPGLAFQILAARKE